MELNSPLLILRSRMRRRPVETGRPSRHLTHPRIVSGPNKALRQFTITRSAVAARRRCAQSLSEAAVFAGVQPAWNRHARALFMSTALQSPPAGIDLPGTALAGRGWRARVHDDDFVSQDRRDGCAPAREFELHASGERALRVGVGRHSKNARRGAAQRADQISNTLAYRSH